MKKSDFVTTFGIHNTSIDISKGSILVCGSSLETSSCHALYAYLMIDTGPVVPFLSLIDQIENCGIFMNDIAF